MNELYAALLSWAVTLSGYPMPEHQADVVKVSHAYLVDHACHGRECKVMGWFPPGQTIYLDERLNPQENLLAASILVHEMVHHLQHEAGRIQPEKWSCENSIQLEREAYAIQREFLLRYGVYQPVGVSMHRVGCELAHTGVLESTGVAAVAEDTGEQVPAGAPVSRPAAYSRSWLVPGAGDWRGR